MLCVISQVLKFQGLPQSLDSSSLSWHLKREQGGPGVLQQEHLNQRCHERGLISKSSELHLDQEGRGNGGIAELRRLKNEGEFTVHICDTPG